LPSSGPHETTGFARVRRFTLASLLLIGNFRKDWLAG
jgi:hypothetical protein